MTVLADWQIENMAQHGGIDPYDPEMLQPSSYDVRLATSFRRFLKPGEAHPDFGEESPVNWVDPHDQHCLDKLTIPEEAAPGTPVVLRSREFMLACTIERVCVPPDLVCRLEGKSSLGRVGLAIHITAGYIDPGFNGNITLEMVNMAPKPIVLTPGMAVAQIGFLQMAAVPRRTYHGRYQGDSKATPSRYATPKDKLPDEEQARWDEPSLM